MLNGRESAVRQWRHFTGSLPVRSADGRRLSSHWALYSTKSNDEKSGAIAGCCWNAQSMHGREFTFWTSSFVRTLWHTAYKLLDTVNIHWRTHCTANGRQLQTEHHESKVSSEIQILNSTAATAFDEEFHRIHPNQTAIWSGLSFRIRVQERGLWNFTHCHSTHGHSTRAFSDTLQSVCVQICIMLQLCRAACRSASHPVQYQKGQQ